MNRVDSNGLGKLAANRTRGVCPTVVLCRIDQDQNRAWRRSPNKRATFLSLIASMVAGDIGMVKYRAAAVQGVRHAAARPRTSAGQSSRYGFEPVGEEPIGAGDPVEHEAGVARAVVARLRRGVIEAERTAVAGIDALVRDARVEVGAGTGAGAVQPEPVSWKPGLHWYITANGHPAGPRHPTQRPLPVDFHHLPQSLAGR